MARKSFVVVCLALSLMCGCSSVLREEGSTARSEVVGNPLVVAPLDVITSKGGRSLSRINLNDGPGIAALFNTRYNEIVSACTQPGTGAVRGYYFCSGVLLRTVDDGGFKPWEYSPTAIRLRGISFSWLRSDVTTPNLYHAAGFILLSPTDYQNGVVPGIVAQDLTVCVYPFDAWTTRMMNRNYAGCDFEGTGTGVPQKHWGSCESKLNIFSSGQWNTYFNSVAKVNYKQCSWNADNPQGWRNMIESRLVFNDQHGWNEVMLEGPPTGHEDNYNEAMRYWTTAFFYDIKKTDALKYAQNFQRKMAATGKRVPILKLDFSAAARSRFQYQLADQVAYP